MPKSRGKNKNKNPVKRMKVDKRSTSRKTLADGRDNNNNNSNNNNNNNNNVSITGLPLELVNESLTSVEAAERLRAAGVDPRKHPERLDSMAAQILLQEALDREEG